MARMSIDDMFLRDPRVAKLARAIGVSKFDARGRLLEVIGIVYDRVDDVLSESDIDIAAEHDGFTQRMIECDLVVPVRGKYRIRGASERINYLRTREESGRAGGIKSGESRRKQPKQTPKVDTKVTFEASEATPNPIPIPIPSVPDPVSASAPVPDPKNATPSGGDDLFGELVRKTNEATGDIGAARAAPVLRQREKRLKQQADHTPALEAFDSYFRKANDGAKPTWDGKRVSMLKTLVGKHTCVEVVRCIGILVSTPPPFPPQPWDLQTFVANFDRCRTTPKQTLGVSGAVLRIATGADE